MKKIVLVMVMVMTFGLFGCATTSSSGSWTPLPEPGTPSAVKIVPPGTDVPPQIAAYSGIWEGRWGNGRSVTIIIEQIKPSEIIAIYSWGSLPNSEGGWRRVIGRVEKDSIVLQWSGRTVFLTITDSKKNTIDAEYRRDTILRATLYKKPN